MKSFKLPLLFLAFLTIFSCAKKDSFSEDVEVQNFVWKGLNAYYYWQGDVADLSDRRFSSDLQLYTYLKGFENPADLFESLLNRPTDRFSWIVSDYIALEQSFQGTTETTGMEFGLHTFTNDQSKVYGYVRYVVPNTDAAANNVTRGMIFTQVNGTDITPDNYRSLLFSSAGSYTIHLADFNSGNPVTNGATISLNKSEVTENPVFTTSVFNEGSKKIGYLMYNSFTPNFDDELNAAFAQFKNEMVTDLIVDLRYNGGGSVRTATYLASMITGQFNGELFAKQRWNSKVEASVDANRFIDVFPSQIDNGIVTEPINSLNLSSVYFITSGSTASASELVINGLIPYINVKQVGTTTIGKNVGSITLYDSENFTKDNVNPNHNWAMQPIVLEIENKDGNNSVTGFVPTVEFPEDYGNLGQLGDRNEPLLDRTITLIVTGRTPFDTRNINNTPELTNSKLHTPTSNNMYVNWK